MEPSQNCQSLVEKSENCKLVAYRDAVGVWTIGWGHTGPEVHEGLVWTQEQADAQLALDIAEASRGVSRLVTVPLTQGQFDALTDFVFNLGSGKLQESTLLRLLNGGNYAGVPDQLYRKDADGTEHGWIYGGGEILPGLVTRRKAEIELWNS